MGYSYETYEKIHRAWTMIYSGALDALDCGHYEYDGGIFVNVMEYETKESGRFEAHRKYIDVQYIVSGEEAIAVAPTDSLRVTREYDADGDILFGEGEGTRYTLRAGQAIVLMPEEAHMPSLRTLRTDKPGKVRKAVVKIPVG